MQKNKQSEAQLKKVRAYKKKKVYGLKGDCFFIGLGSK